MTKAEEMAMKTVHDLGVAGVSDVCNYTGLSPDDVTAALNSLRKKRYISIARADWVLQKNEYNEYILVEDILVGLDYFLELTPEGKEAAQGIPNINEPMCIPTTNIQLEKMEELNGERKDGAD